MSIINKKHIENKTINHKAIRITLITLLVLSIFFLFMLYKNEGRIEKIDLEAIPKTTDFVVAIDTLNFGKDTIHLEGLFYRENEPINHFNNRVLLKEKESGITYMLPTESFPKKDIIAEEDEVNYRNILATAKSLQFDFVNNDYEILFLYDSNDLKSYQESGYTVSNWRIKNEQ